MGPAQELRVSEPAEKADYGFDAPIVPVMLALGGSAGLAVAVASWFSAWGSLPTGWFVLVGTTNLGSAALYVYATRRGKHRAWERILDTAGWRGDETVLDLGCGRGAVLVAVARRLPHGRAVGIDIWARRDQSGNSIDATLHNVELEGVADRVEIHTADIRRLPFPDSAFDAVLSSLVVHNIGGAGERQKALAEAVRVLRPGGRAFLADIRHVNEYRRELGRLGLQDVTIRELGAGVGFGNPLLRIRLVTGTKPVTDAGARG